MKKLHSILLVEDEIPLQEAVKIKLESEGLEVVAARSVEQALSYLEEKVRVDAIWLDHYLLGKENGLDFVAKLKEEGSEWSTIPVFLVTNTASREKVSSYLRLGINRYYTKSDFALSDIIADIKKALKTEPDSIKE